MKLNLFSAFTGPHLLPPAGAAVIAVVRGHLLGQRDWRRPLRQDDLCRQPQRQDKRAAGRW